MNRVRIWAFGSAAAIAVIAGSALAQETTTYTYDGLGRLKSSSIAGGPNDTRKTGTCFDPAGNRTRYDVATSAPAACPVPMPTPMPSPTPAPTPTPTNQPPGANADSTTFNCSVSKTLNLTANDTDPENNLPLSVVSVTSGSPSSVWASVTSTSSVQIASNGTGTFSLSYVVADTLGATSTGSISITVTGNPATCQAGPPE